MVPNLPTLRSTGAPVMNTYGNTVQRYFDDDPDHCRYKFDGLAEKADGWEQFDTSQDAWYFGVWVNKSARCIWTFAEGDFTVVTCHNDKTFNAEIQHMIQFYQPGFICKVFSEDECAVYEQDRNDFLIGGAGEQRQEHISDGPAAPGRNETNP